MRSGEKKTREILPGIDNNRRVSLRDSVVNIFARKLRVSIQRCYRGLSYEAKTLARKIRDDCDDDDDGGDTRQIVRKVPVASFSPTKLFGVKPTCTSRWIRDVREICPGPSTRASPSHRN